MKYKALFLLLLISTMAYADNFTGTWKGKGICGDSTIQISLSVILQNDSFVGVFLHEPASFTLQDSCFNGINLHLLSSKVQLYNRNNDLLRRQAKGEKVTLYQEIRLDGMLTDNLNQLNGEFTYLGKVYHAELFRSDQPLYRPQEPRKPYSYYCEEVKFTNQKDNVTLAGTLTLPAKEGRFPAVILKSGSNPVNRDCEDGSYHHMFLVLADYLTRHGIAVLRYDERSIAKSTGDFWQSTAEDFANDLKAGYELLATRKEIMSDHIGIIGHSEGAMVAAMAASKSNDFNFIVMLGGPGIPLRNVFEMQRESNYKSGDLDRVAYRKTKEQDEILYKLADQHMEQKLIQAAMFEYGKKLNDAEWELKPDSDKSVVKKIAMASVMGIISSPHHLYMLNADPAEFISKLTCPVLVLNGSNDLQVEAKINQQAIRKSLKKANNKDFKIIELDKLNHCFQECQTGSRKEARTLEQTFSPKALEIIAQWIKEHVEK
jgi:pimeloyl-ACP methyl ester carboxylesterase